LAFKGQRHIVGGYRGVIMRKDMVVEWREGSVIHWHYNLIVRFSLHVCREKFGMTFRTYRYPLLLLNEQQPSVIVDTRKCKDWLQTFRREIIFIAYY
jgi:hypothetical protein